MTTKPWPESNPHPERGPLWVQWDADTDAIAIARQLGQESPTPSTKKVLWKHAIGERLPDGREITGARCCNDGSVVIEADGPDGIHVAGALDGPDGMVEVLA